MMKIYDIIFLDKYESCDNVNKKIIMKICNNDTLTNIEATEFLNYFCSAIREKMGITDPMDDNCKVCYETSMIFGRLMMVQFDCDVESLNIKNLLEIPLTHYANIIFLNVNNTEKAYLVDMTYSQFFGENIVLDDINGKNGKHVPTERVFGKMKEEDFVKKLRQFGFVELNDEILKKYIDAFLNICNVHNKAERCIKLQKLLANRKICLNYSDVSKRNIR